MISLTDYLAESLNGTLNLSASIAYPIFADLYLYLDNNTEFLRRLQSICDTYRKKYNENFSEQILINSKIFSKFIDDLIESYSKNVREINVNFATKKHFMEEVASKMVIKVRTENDLPEINEEN